MEVSGSFPGLIFHIQDVENEPPVLKEIPPWITGVSSRAGTAGVSSRAGTDFTVKNTEKS